MASMLKSTMNTRAIMPDSLRFVRSDVPDRLSEKEIKWLIDKNITTIVDLREEQEREHKPCSLTMHEAFQYYCMPVTGGNAVPKSCGEVSKSYIAMCDDKMDEIINTILNADSNVLYFCNAGKDRTGVVSAILLNKMGLSREYIIEDYMQSAFNLKEMIDAYVEQFPEIDREIITPREMYMEEFLEWML